MGNSVSTIAEMETLRQERDEYRDLAEARDVALTEYFENDARDNRVEGLRAASRIVGGMAVGPGHFVGDDNKRTDAKTKALEMAKTFETYLAGEK